MINIVGINKVETEKDNDKISENICNESLIRIHYDTPQHISLHQLVESSIIMIETKSSIGIKLTPEIVTIIHKLLNLENDINIFDDLEKLIFGIIKDNKINVKEVPQLIIIIQKLYQTIYSLKIKGIKINSRYCAIITETCLKYIYHLLVFKNKIILDEHEKPIFLGETNELIESCISLLKFPKAIKVKGCFLK
jgi:hypothetical protein